MTNSDDSGENSTRQPLSAVGSRLMRDEGALTAFVRNHRLLFTLLFFGVLSAISVTLSFLLRFVVLDQVLASVFVQWQVWWLAMLAVTVPLRMFFFWLTGVHRQSWRFASIEDLPPLVFSVLSSSALIIVALWVFWRRPGGFPLSTLAIDMVLCLGLVSGGRFAYRLIGGPSDRLGNRKARRRALIIGAGNAGALTIEAMQSPRLGGFKPVAIVDDNAQARGMRIRGVPVMGTIDEIDAVAHIAHADVLVLSIPAATPAQLYRIVSRCQETGLPLKSVPSFWEIMESDKPGVRRVEDFSTTSLLSRRPVAGDQQILVDLVKGRRVLVTGAAGSIGSELCRQVVASGAAYLACLDKDENGLFRIERELRDGGARANLEFMLGDIRDEVRLERFFGDARPEIVFHAAAYKHVPILQFHPEEAVLNNVFGTRQLADMAVRYGVGRFVMISTDKAVKPTNVMGASKQIAEKLVLARHEAAGAGTRFMIIRFGNVLGSAGSVVEMFSKQIAAGGPVTVTDATMERFFMTIAEAVQLVLFAAAMGTGGDVFILDMGKPVKIDDLARQMIRLSGLTPDIDIAIRYIGLRPGEKLYEELWSEGEEPQSTSNPGILAARRQPIDSALVEVGAARLIAAARIGDRPTLWTELLTLVPDFQGLTGDDARMPPR
ncbi:MAG: polysaccharide biosynthesis protein [bacterium]|nr:polysaccharide biosynthesis protein [bacterium]